MIGHDIRHQVEVGKKIQTDLGEVTVAGTVAATYFGNVNAIYLFCPEDTFRKLTGESDYVIIDMQLANKATDEDVSAIRAMVGDGVQFSDQRSKNKEAKIVYYSVALLVYGFLTVIAMITVFNIMNQYFHEHCCENEVIWRHVGHWHGRESVDKNDHSGILDLFPIGQCGWLRHWTASASVLIQQNSNVYVGYALEYSLI